MKRINIIDKSCVCLFCLLVLISCSSKEIQKPLPDKLNPHLKYFGFLLIDVGWDDPTDSENKTNYLEEVQPFTNVADIFPIGPGDNIVERMQTMHEAEVDVMIHINELFFKQIKKGGSKSGVIYGLREDYQERWNTFVAVNDLWTNDFMISCFYIGEEPAWNSIAEEEFKVVCSFLKERFPSIPLMSIEAYAAMDELYVPRELDWVGFDHYFLKMPSENSTFQKELDILKSKMQAHQKIMLIMDSHWIDYFHGSAGIAMQDMDVIARDYYQMANTDTTVIGVLGYHWPSGFDLKRTIGARDLPMHVKEEYVNIGKHITGK